MTIETFENYIAIHNLEDYETSEKNTLIRPEESEFHIYILKIFNNLIVDYMYKTKKCNNYKKVNDSIKTYITQNVKKDKYKYFLIKEKKTFFSTIKKWLPNNSKIREFKKIISIIEYDIDTYKNKISKLEKFINHAHKFFYTKFLFLISSLIFFFILYEMSILYNFGFLYDEINIEKLINANEFLWTVLMPLFLIMFVSIFIIFAIPILTEKRKLIYIKLIFVISALLILISPTIYIFQDIIKIHYNKQNPNSSHIDIYLQIGTYPKIGKINLINDNTILALLRYEQNGLIYYNRVDDFNKTAIINDLDNNKNLILSYYNDSKNIQKIHAINIKQVDTIDFFSEKKVFEEVLHYKVKK